MGHKHAGFCRDGLLFGALFSLVDNGFFGFIWTPIYSYIGARMIGLTGSPQGVSFPYLREASFYLSGYEGAGIWFAPVPIFQWGYEAQTFKQQD